MTRQTLVSKTENCPRCKFNDKTRPLRQNSRISDNIRAWYRDNTTYTEEQIKNANFECERCSILFIRQQESKVNPCCKQNWINVAGGIVVCEKCGNEHFFAKHESLTDNIIRDLDQDE